MFLRLLLSLLLSFVVFSADYDQPHVCSIYEDGASECSVGNVVVKPSKENPTEADWQLCKLTGITSNDCVYTVVSTTHQKKTNYQYVCFDRSNCSKDNSTRVTYTQYDDLQDSMLAEFKPKFGQIGYLAEGRKDSDGNTSFKTSSNLNNFGNTKEHQNLNSIQTNKPTTRRVVEMGSGTYVLYPKSQDEEAIPAHVPQSDRKLEYLLYSNKFWVEGNLNNGQSGTALFDKESGKILGTAIGSHQFANQALFNSIDNIAENYDNFVESRPTVGTKEYHKSSVNRIGHIYKDKFPDGSTRRIIELSKDFSDLLGVKEVAFGKKEVDEGKSDNIIYQSDTVGKQNDTVGKQNDTVGKQNDTVGKQNDTVGKQNDTVGKQNDTVGKQNDTVGKQNDTVGKQNDTVGKQNDTVGKQNDTVGKQHDDQGVECKPQSSVEDKDEGLLDYLGQRYGLYLDGKHTIGFKVKTKTEPKKSFNFVANEELLFFLQENIGNVEVEPIYAHSEDNGVAKRFNMFKQNEEQLRKLDGKKKCFNYDQHKKSCFKYKVDFNSGEVKISLDGKPALVINKFGQEVGKEDKGLRPWSKIKHGNKEIFLDFRGLFFTNLDNVTATKSTRDISSKDKLQIVEDNDYPYMMITVKDPDSRKGSYPIKIK